MSPSDGFLICLFVFVLSCSISEAAVKTAPQNSKDATGSQSSCGNGTITATVTTTEIKRVYNASTGTWMNVTVTANSTVTRPNGANLTDCSQQPPNPPPTPVEKCNGSITATVMVTEMQRVYNSTTGTWMNVTVTSNKTVTRPNGANLTDCKQPPQPPKSICYSNPCLHGGTCKENGLKFSCFCPAEFSGNRCETKIVPPTGPCNGTSTVTVTVTETQLVFNSTTGLWANVTVSSNKTVTRPNGANLTDCQPPPPTKGICYSNPCLHGGTCKENGPKFSCFCRAEFSGNRCETKIVPPTGPCNGTSSVTVTVTDTQLVFNSTTGLYVNVTVTSNKTVTRPNGANMTDCKPPKPPQTNCVSNPCLNGGSCQMNGPGDFFCFCHRGFTGKRCEAKIDPPTGWRAFVYFQQYMMKWDFEMWKGYFQSVSKNMWDFDQFARDLGNLTGIPCSDASQNRLQISTIMNVFDVLRDIEKDDGKDDSCRWLKSSLHMNVRHRDFCMANGDKDNSTKHMDSSNSDVMASRLRMSHNAEMGGFGEILCALPFRGNKTVWTDDKVKDNKTCNIWAIRDVILASLQIKLGWQDMSACREATLILTYLKRQLEPCNERLRFLLAILIRQAEMRQRMICTPPTCNIPYASVCALDAEMRIKKFMDDGKDMGQHQTPLNGTKLPDMEKFCRDIKVTFACVTNHTIICSVENYGPVNMRITRVVQQFRKICANYTTLPPEKCIPPPPMPLDYGSKDMNISGNSSNTGVGSPGGANDGNESLVKLIKFLSKYSLFNDTFLCQATLRNIAKNNTDLVEEYCGFENRKDNLRCISRIVDPTTTTVGFEKCSGSDARCLWSPTSSHCATPAACKAGTQLECCDTNFCNDPNTNNFNETCECQLDRATKILGFITSNPNVSSSQCSNSIPMLSGYMKGCSSLQRNYLAALPDFLMAARKCGELNTAVVLHAPRCGNACPADILDTVANCRKLSSGTSKKAVCGGDNTQCAEGKAVGCSGRQMERMHYARIITALKAGCTDPAEMAEIVQSGLALNDERIGSIYEEVAVATNCTSEVGSANVSSSDIPERFMYCLTRNGFPRSPLSLVGRRFLHTVSSLAKSIKELIASKKYDGSCVAPQFALFLNTHLLRGYVPGGSTTVCTETYYDLVKNCSSDMKKAFLAPFIADCSEAYASSCELAGVKSCFWDFFMSRIKISGRLETCLKSRTVQCEPYAKEGIFQVFREVVEYAKGLDWPGDNDGKDDDDKEPVVIPLPYTKDNIEKYYGDSKCACDPALAVHCIFDVHHHSKQDDVDWEGLCPMVNRSIMCAQRFVQGCEECEKKTVMEIVSKLNYGLRKTCGNPPETVCKSIKAMDCVTDLMKYQKENPQANNITTCVEISKTRKCIEENLEGCEKTTEMKVNLLLDEVIERWDDLACEDRDSRLDTCREKFEYSVKHILSFDADSMFNDLAVNTTLDYADLQEQCEKMETAWDCLSNTFELIKDRPGSVIIRDSLKGIYVSMQKICNRSPAKLECNVCFGQGSKSCSSGSSVEVCNPNSICQTVTVNDKVTTRGCIPRTSCNPGCKGDTCAFCCSGNRCNDLDNGPITGSCDRLAMSKCIFDLSATFTQGESFSCSMVEFALECLEHERTKCEMGGFSFSLESISSASLRAAVKVCLRKEADQTCSILPIITTASYISRAGSLDREDVCKMVAGNRKAIKIAAEDCTDEETADIKRNAVEFENFLGYLDCKVPYGFVLGGGCDISQAMSCFMRLPSQKLRVCNDLAQVAVCVKKYMAACKPNLFTWPIRQKFGAILRNTENGTCDAKLMDKDERDKPTTKIETCLDGFVRALDGAVTSYTIKMAMRQLQECVFGLDPDMVLDLNSVQKLSLGNLASILEALMENKMKPMANDSSSVSDMCNEAMGTLVRQHFVNALVLPLSVSSNVPSVCKSLDEQVKVVTNVVCSAELKNESEALEDTLDLLDTIREKLIVRYCSEATPIPRCLLSRAEQCLERFSAYVSPGQDSVDVLCREAKSLVRCTKSYASACAQPGAVTEFKTKSLFAMDTITQVCYEDPDLVAEARCTLLRQVNFEARCNLTALSTCEDPPSPTNCTLQDEEKAACFLGNVDGCIDQVISTYPKTYQLFSNYLKTCRPTTRPDGTPVRSADLYKRCSQPSGTCDVQAAAKCLSTFAPSIVANVTFGSNGLRRCLETNYYCFSSVISLLSTNISEYSQILVHALQFTPAWQEVDSGLLIRLLNLPSYIMNALQQTPAVDLNLWNICWDMDRALKSLKAVEEKFPDMDLPSFKASTQNLKFTIATLCNNFGAVAEMLQFPNQENPTCAAPAIRANIDLLMSRSISEFYTSKQVGAQSVCSLYKSLNASLGASLQVSPLSLDDCSDGLQAQAHFSMLAVRLIIHSRCEMAQSGGSPRCDVREVRECVKKLYQSIRQLGLTKSHADVCNDRQVTEQCVTRFSFKCDKSRLSQISFIWGSVSGAAQRSCDVVNPPAQCDAYMDGDIPTCDVMKAKKCSLKQLRNALNPFAPKDRKCRSLETNTECVKMYTTSCNDTGLPKIFILPEKLEGVKNMLMCDKDGDDQEFGCRKGCMLEAAMECLEDFKDSMTMNMWGVFTPATCSLINDMRFCVLTNTKNCRQKERHGVERAQDKLLMKFPEHHSACLNVATCSANFDSLVRQIEDLRPRDDSANGGDMGKDGDKWADGKDDKGKGRGPSLEALCSRIRHSWSTCMEPGLKLLPKDKFSTAKAMYSAIWSAVSEKCSDTTQVKCYTCNNETDLAQCKKASETCPYNKQACLFKQISDGKMHYYAMCANPRSCYNDNNANTVVSCCTGDLCNTPSGLTTSALSLEPRTCIFEKALTCALDFTMMYISTEDMDCKETTEKLSCVQRYGQTCSSKSGKELTQATNNLYLELASSSCVINPAPEDCFSLSIISMQSILSNAYISEGNLPCMALQEAEASVAQTIATGNCSDAGRISLQSSLAFLKDIIGSYCEADTCKAVSWADVLNADKGCTGQIFQGIMYIYKGFAELAKGTPKCSLLESYLEEADNRLGKCKLVGFLQSKLDGLKNTVQGQCGAPVSANLPAVCEGTCQTDVVLTYVRDLRDTFDDDADRNATCLNLMQMERVYDVYTKDCTSVQQRDVVKVIEASLAPEIAFCKMEDSSFELELELKRDIFFQAIDCQINFQNEVSESFVNSDQQRMCQAVTDLEQCQYDIPSVFENFVMGQTKSLLSLIESVGLCPTNLGTNSGQPIERRRKRSVCDLQRLGALIQELIVLPSIPSATFESRNLYCQETAASFKEAENLRTACSKNLNPFQEKFYSIMKSNVENFNEEKCPPLRFEQEGCDLNQVDTCFNDLSLILEFPIAPTESICRLTTFSMKCLYRFTHNCSGADATMAAQFKTRAFSMVKGIAVNKCPTLLEFFFCNGDLSTPSEGCQLEKAKKCAADSMPILSQSLTPGYCDSKQDLVDCTKESLIGCEDDEINSVSLPSAQLNSMCGITNTSLDGVCRSESACPNDEVRACLDKLDNCTTITQDYSCIARLDSAYPQCTRSIGSWIVKMRSVIALKTFIAGCGGTLTMFDTTLSSKLCIRIASDVISDQLPRAVGTADQLLRRTVNTVWQCMTTSAIAVNIDVRMVQEFFQTVNNTLDESKIPAIRPSGPTLTDTSNCSYSKVTACLFEKMGFLLYIKLLNIEEREGYCKAFTDNTISECFTENLEGCPRDRSLFYRRFNADLDSIINKLKLCEDPHTCIVSEGFACVNKLGMQVSQYDRTNDKVAVCLARDEAKSCIESFTFTCSTGRTNQVMNAYNELATKTDLDNLCSGIELPPPPICPELPQEKRICHMGNAFTCLFKFSINILQGDSLIWRQQCMTIQKMMTCVAKSTSGCNETSSDVGSIRKLLKDFVERASDHCPWLTPDLCTEQTPCPVTTAGCEEVLEQGLINRVADVCTLERNASECVKNYTLECTRAQRNQAKEVMQRKLQAAGLSGELWCSNGKIDGHLYSFLTASADVSVSSRKAGACSKLTSLYDAFNSKFSNPDSSKFLTLAKSLIDQLYIERNSECSGNETSQCAVEFPSRAFSTLITDLMVKDDLSDTTFCAQSRALLLKNDKKDGCTSQMYNVLETPYKSRCVDVPSSCSDAESAIARCIANFGELTTQTCSYQQRAAGCVATHLPADCPYKSQWLNISSLCSDVVVLQATHSQSSRQYISETGLVATLGWKLVAGSDNFTVTIDPVADDPSSAPRCLLGPNQNDPIPQVFYKGQRVQEPGQGTVEFKVYGREDYKKDGPQMVQVGFTLNSGSISYHLPDTKVYVADRNLPNSMCSSINDPHVATFDGLKYSNMDVDYFILWRHTMLAEAVVVQYSQCAKYGTCNCGCKVYAGQSSVTFDLCDPKSDLVTYSAETGADALNQQRMAVLMETDVKTYSVVLVDSGTIVKVRIEGEYMNVWITPSGRDVGATQGLCGVYDGDGYNDFQLPDGSQYDLQESDDQSGELTPDAFNAQWKLSSTQADDYTQVFAPNVTVTTAAVPTYCHTWSDGSGQAPTTNCGKYANLAICGIVNGKDLTAALLADFKQSQNVVTLNGRRKRQATQAQVASPRNRTATWPTASGWTKESAREWCLDNIPDDTLQKCTDAISSLDGTMQSFQLYKQIDECIVDIKVSDGTQWIEATRVSAYEQCIIELNQNPSYQTNLDSSTLALLFLDATCTPPDCSGHGTCTKGSCICNDGYYGTRCDIQSAGLTPPTLKIPEDGAHMCEIDSNSDCSSVFISGSNFIYSSRLSCHFKEVQVTESGVIDVPGGATEVVRAELIARDRVRCDLGDRSTWKRTRHVSVSNDGATPDPRYQLFVAYDPVCFNCGPTSCTRQRDVCIIGDTCVKPGVSSIYDDCEYCNLENPTEWTIRTDLGHCQDRTSEEQTDRSVNGLLLPLIGVGCALIVIVIVLILGLMAYLKRRESQRRSEMDKRYGHRNPTYLGDEPPSYIESALRVNIRHHDQAGRNLGLDRYQADA